jgi:sn-glycerol 3-phosphate transport system ATP-binding protein
VATLELENVSKTYSGGVEAVKSISLSVPDGALCVLVGPSGCGKSTLLRMIAGLETMTAGSIRIGGRAVDRLGPAERDIAMVFQNYALYPHMSVYDNMAYGLRNRGMPKPEIDARVREAARSLELEALLKRRPRELSGGQRQRVAMGRAIVREPKAFLFDEPLSNLDAKLRGQMRVEIKAIQRATGVTGVYVTHDQVEAMTLADVLVVMNAGRAEQVGDPLGIYNDPASAFVATFIGSPAMNLVPARVAGGALALAGGQALDLPDLSLPAPGRPLLFGVRPEHLVLADAGSAHLTLRARAVEALGADTLIYGRLGADEKEDMVARLPGGTPVREGDDLPLRIRPGSAFLFEAESGKRLGN